MLGDLAAARQAFASELSAVTPASARGPAAREDYLLDPDVVYLNHASIGTIPRAVHAARARYLDLCETNPWLYMWGDAWEEPRERVREAAAALLGASPSEIAFTHNTTEGFNTLAQGLPLGPGDEVLFSSLNHPGASVCWQHYAPRRGYAVSRFAFPVADVTRMGVDDILALYDRHITPRTRVLVFPHVDNVLGIRHPARALCALARARGVEFVAIDGAQSIGMIPVDVRALDADFYAGSPHKWLQAPKGLGVLYVRDAVRAALEPMWVTWGQARWQGSARIFEDYGTRNLPELLALGDAIAYQDRLGTVAKVDRYRALWRFAQDRVEGSETLVWRSPADWDRAASLYAVAVRDRPIGRIAASLWPAQGMVFRAFGQADLNTARLSPNTFNTEDEIDRTLAAMERAGA